MAVEESTGNVMGKGKSDRGAGATTAACCVGWKH